MIFAYLCDLLTAKTIPEINMSKINMIDIYFKSEANNLSFAYGIIIPLLTTLEQ